MKSHYTMGQYDVHTMELISEGIGKGEVHLLTYNDSYLKDSYITQLAEEFVLKGKQVIIIQPSPSNYTLKDIFISRIHFRNNPHNFPSVQEVQEISKEIQATEQQITIIYMEPELSMDYLNKQVLNSLSHSDGEKLLIVEDFADSTLKMSFEAERWAKDWNIPCIVTKKINSPEFPYIFCRFPYDYESIFFLNAQHPNLYDLSKNKNLAYEFTLKYANMSSQENESYYTLRPASGYCQQA